ncbi:MAG: hypothetical protein AAF629_19185 [Chloroflexota bacterium]
MSNQQNYPIDALQTEGASSKKTWSTPDLIELDLASTQLSAPSPGTNDGTAGSS